MIYVTGDTHGNQLLWSEYFTRFLGKGDILIISGDFGVGFFDGRQWPEEMFYDYLAEQDYMVLFTDGNHENFTKLNSYPIEVWNGGKVHFIRKNVIHLMRGEVYDIEGERCFCFGGGYSLDKDYRVPGKTWWAEEMPNEEEFKNAVKNLEVCGFKVNYIFTHTAPLDSIEYLSRLRLGIKRMIIEEQPLTGFLKWVEENVQYDRWYFGHFHVDREIWKKQYALLDGIREVQTGKLIKMRI